MRIARLYICLIATAVEIAFAGCAPVNTCFPLRPPETGETYVGFHSTFPFNNFAHLSLQLSVFHGISENNVLGCTLSPCFPPLFIAPTAIGYGHYWTGDASHQFLQLDLALTHYNPFCQVSYAVINTHGETGSAIKIGAGLASKVGIGSTFLPSSSRIRDLEVVPSIECSIQHREARVSIGTSFGLTKKIEKNLSRARGKERFEYSIDEVDTILVEPKSAWGGYGIVLKNGTMLNVRYRDPYVDCYACAQEIKNQNAYTASKMHRCYWVWYSSGRSPLPAGRPCLLELNMSEILRNMTDSRVLIIKEDEDVTERSCNSVNSWIEDIFVDIGYVKYD